MVKNRSCERRRLRLIVSSIFRE